MNVTNPTMDYDDLWNPGPGSLGTAYSISSDAPEKDCVERLREVVEEVTGKILPRQNKKIGFY